MNSPIKQERLYSIQQFQQKKQQLVVSKLCNILEIDPQIKNSKIMLLEILKKLKTDSKNLEEYYKLNDLLNFLNENSEKIIKNEEIILLPKIGKEKSSEFMPIPVDDLVKMPGKRRMIDELKKKEKKYLKACINIFVFLFAVMLFEVLY